MAHRDWCFTLNNPTTQDLHDIVSWCDKGAMTYIVFQAEKGENDTLHLQGYLEFNQPITLSRLKNGYNDRAHWESRRGTQQQAITYCTKEDTRVKGPWIWGEPKKQGQRNDLNGLYDMICEGKSVNDVIEANPAAYIKYNRGIDKIMLLQLDKIKRPVPQVYVRYGSSGTGKTRYVYDNYDDIYSVPIPNNGTVWFDGYHGQQVLLIDDFSGWMPFKFLLQLLDRYPIRLPYKGGYVNMVSPIIYITSSVHPREWYKSTRENGDATTQILRRITSIVSTDPEISEFGL